MDEKLEKILFKADLAIETDFEGDRTFRVHVTVAKELIKEAFAEGQILKGSD